MEYTSRDIKYMRDAYAASRASGCLRRHVGCLILEDNELTENYSLGSNRPPRGEPTCEEVGYCLIGKKDGRVRCMRTIHAEITAISNAAKNGICTENGIAYCTTKPCLDCAKALL